MQTNPVVVLRILAGLREAGFVRSEKGHGGGWTIARDLSAITMRDVYDAIGRPHLMAMGNRTDAPGRSEEHTSELQSLMRISYAVFCLKKKKRHKRKRRF